MMAFRHLVVIMEMLRSENKAPLEEMRVTVSASRAAIGTIREKMKSKVDAN
jgi:hypothetical protein